LYLQNTQVLWQGIILRSRPYFNLRGRKKLAEWTDDGKGTELEKKGEERE
jgi:hypothetical protein